MTKMDSAANALADLQARLDLLNGQRRADLDRLGRLSLQCDRLALQLAERDAELAGMDSNADLAKGRPHAAIDAFLLMPAAVRTLLRGEAPALGSQTTASLASKIMSSVLLRYARAAAARRDYARAEAWYQAILLLTPRAFVWRQLGNMQAGQGLFAAAIESFDRAITLDDGDGEAWHAKARALKTLDRRDEANAALARALALKPALTSRGS